MKDRHALPGMLDENVLVRVAGVGSDVGSRERVVEVEKETERVLRVRGRLYSTEEARRRIPDGRLRRVVAGDVSKRPF